MNDQRSLGLLVGLAALMAMLAFFGEEDQEADMQAHNYCEMRAIWQESGEEYGWPEGAINGLTDEVCE